MVLFLVACRGVEYQLPRFRLPLANNAEQASRGAPVLPLMKCLV
jgi:hypothetical protein